MASVKSFLLAGILGSTVYSVLASPTPVQINLSSRRELKRFSSRASKNLPKTNVPLKNYYDGTDLQWYGEIQVGTPGQKQVALKESEGLDYPTSILADLSCDVCTKHRKFNRNESSTFSDYNEAYYAEFATGVGVDPTNYEWLVYSAVRDVVSIAGLPAIPTDLYLITNESTGFWDAPFDGVFGYNSHGSFFQSLVDQGLAPVLGFWLAPKDIGDAQMTLGGVDEAKLEGKQVTYIPLAKEAHGFWQLESTQFGVNGQTNEELNQIRQVYFDTATANLQFPKNTTEALYALISPKIKPFGDNGAYGLPCSEISSIQARLDFTFKDQVGKDVVISVPPGELNVGPFKSDSSICQTLINAGYDQNFIGASLLKHYYSIWDQGSARMGFAA
ncbi:hypothetical protein CTheo_3092 [Ceratobasidium theobromae]|uniref:Peptidase A1 domain-containing protein n=1 Tax=Ceratobasidium theobromae TaxID=1582974 RepID=A0A5N5QPD4_9AGAM|nr:hypothetical protein CTheo_3092 [Ceratobasidium theobromae]